MSDREMWPNEQGKRGQWTAPSTGPAAVGDGDEMAAPAQTSNEQATGPSWPSSTPQAQPGQDRPYGYGAPPAGQHGGQGSADQSYADPSYGAGPGYPQGQYRQPPSGPAPSYGHRPYGQPSQGQGPYGQAPYGQSPYGQPPYSGQPPYAGQSPYGQPPYSQPGQPPYGQPSYGPPPYAGQPPYGQPSYGQPPYGQPPYGSPGGQGPGASAGRSRALRSAAAVLVVVAAAVAGGGASQLIWSSAKPASTAAPSVGAPSGSSGNNDPSGGGDPFGSTPSGTGGTGSGNTGEGAGGPSDVSSIAAKVDPALVDVNVIFNYQSMEGAGTGIVLTSNGLVLTNNHVIDEATKISVTDVGNGQTYAANVVGYDNTHDVALIQLQGASGLTTAKLDSTPASVGEAVVAIGNAGGTGGTPTSAGGSVTALGQKITASDELTQRSEDLTGLIEVNANVEAGDSGGPLVNADGQVEGMDTAASEGFNFQTQGNQGFAIPISFAMGIARDIESGKDTSTVHVGQTAFLGLLLSPPGQSSTSGVPPSGSPFGGTGGTTPTCPANPAGLEVSGVVAGTPAQKAGITGCDTITTLNGTNLSSAEALTKLLVGYHPGQKVTIGWVTSTGQARSASIVLASGPPS